MHVKVYSSKSLVVWLCIVTELFSEVIATGSAPIGIEMKYNE